MATGSDRVQRGIQSIEVGGQLLRAMVHHGRPMALKDLAREADMTPAKAARLLRGRHRVALSGTPVENRIDELWSRSPRRPRRST